MEVHHMPFQQVLPTESIVCTLAFMATPDHGTMEALWLSRVLKRVAPKIFGQPEAPSASGHWTGICVTILLGMLTVRTST